MVFFGCDWLAVEWICLIDCLIDCLIICLLLGLCYDAFFVWGVLVWVIGWVVCDFVLGWRCFLFGYLFCFWF